MNIKQNTLEQNKASLNVKDTRPIDFQMVLYKERAKVNLCCKKKKNIDKSLLKMHVGLKLLQCSVSSFLPFCYPALSHMTKVALPKYLTKSRNSSFLRFFTINE